VKYVYSVMILQYYKHLLSATAVFIHWYSITQTQPLTNSVAVLPSYWSASFNDRGKMYLIRYISS